MKVCTACGIEYPNDVLFCQRDGTPLRPGDPTADLVGQVVADRYHITKKLGEGGMGQVYLAEHVKMGRRCAIKIMSPGMMNDPDAISRFNREAANASRISHPNVCSIYDFGETPEGLIYLAMEFIEGKSLSGLMEDTGTLPLARAATLTAQTAEALQAAHDLGIVHRDLKPDNIMVLTARGKDTVKVVDFGIAKAVGADGGAQKVTKTGFVVGTPEYMSPEQLSGDPVDGRSDLYSLALVFYRMLTGVTPFPGESQQETMIKRLTDDPLPLTTARPEVHFPPEVQRVLDRALARTPGDRYRQAGDFARDVRALAGTLTGKVDVEAGTQIVAAGGVPATRVDPAVGRPGPARGAPAKAPAPPSAPLTARRSLALPIAAAVAVAALGGGGYALRGRFFGPSVADSLQRLAQGVPSGQQVQPPAGPDSQRPTVVVPARDSARPTTISPAGGRTTPPPVNPGTAAVPGGRRDTTPTAGAVPDVPALTAQLQPYSDNPDFVDDQTQRLAGKRLGQQIYETAGAPKSLRAEAASVVAQALLKEENREGGRTWFKRAVDLDPTNPSAKSWLTILEGL